MTAPNTLELAILAKDVPANPIKSQLPSPLSERLQDREKRRLGDFFGLSNFGINLTKIEPQGISSFCHSHMLQDEFIYILAGYPTLVTTEGTVQLSAGMCAGFKAGTDLAHQLINQTDEEVWYLEVGDRTANDQADYPFEDLKAQFTEKGWVFMHKDGTFYE